MGPALGARPACYLAQALAYQEALLDQLTNHKGSSAFTPKGVLKQTSMAVQIAREDPEGSQGHWQV